MSVRFFHRNLSFSYSNSLLVLFLFVNFHRTSSSSLSFGFCCFSFLGALWLRRFCLNRFAIWHVYFAISFRNLCIGSFEVVFRSTLDFINIFRLALFSWVRFSMRKHHVNCICSKRENFCSSTVNQPTNQPKLMPWNSIQCSMAFCGNEPHRWYFWVLMSFKHCIASHVCWFFFYHLFFFF